MKVRSFMRHAGEFTPVEVELSLSPGLPQISFLGMPDPFIRESVMRIKSALRAQKFEFPKAQQVVVQLRPSHLKKTSRGLDLAVAAALIWETEQAEKPDNLDDLNFYGELSLRGDVYVPDDIDDSENCLSERDIVVTGSAIKSFEGVVWGIKDLRGLCHSREFLRLKREDVKCDRPAPPFSVYTKKQADLLSLLAAGGHSALFVGTPGSGKSATAESVNCFLPEPTPEEWREIRKVSSSFFRTATWRPNVVVHHSVTPLAMTGGGGQIHAGEITRAHGGTLVMDELLEFKPTVQDSIREPLETGTIDIARNGKNRQLLAEFQLIATSNLCRCGNYFPSDRSTCRCSNQRLRTYQEKFSGPVLDRFAVISAFGYEESRSEKLIPSGQILKSVLRATDIRRNRNQPRVNSRLTLNELLEVCNSTPEKIELHTMGLPSQRSAMHVLQVARTLADLDGSQKTKSDHFDRSRMFVVDGRVALLKSLNL